MRVKIFSSKNIMDFENAMNSWFEKNPFIEIYKIKHIDNQMIVFVYYRN